MDSKVYRYVPQYSQQQLLEKESTIGPDQSSRLLMLAVSSCMLSPDVRSKSGTSRVRRVDLASTSQESHVIFLCRLPLTKEAKVKAPASPLSHLHVQHHMSVL